MQQRMVNWNHNNDVKAVSSMLLRISHVQDERKNYANIHLISLQKLCICTLLRTRDLAGSSTVTNSKILQFEFTVLRVYCLHELLNTIIFSQSLHLGMFVKLQHFHKSSGFNNVLLAPSFAL